MQNFSNKNVDVLLRVASLEYLGVVAARLRKDAVSSQLKTDTIDQLLKQVREDEANNAVEEFKSKKHKKKKKSGDKDHEKENIPADKIEVLAKKKLIKDGLLFLLDHKHKRLIAIYFVFRFFSHCCSIILLSILNVILQCFMHGISTSLNGTWI